LVRSCTLDIWNDEEASVMERVGNQRANAYWEADLPPGTRPSGSDVEAMIIFIRQKYEFAKWAVPDDRPPHLPVARRRHRPAPAAGVELADPFESLEQPQIRPEEHTRNVLELDSVPREALGRRWTDRARESITQFKELVVSKFDQLFDRHRHADHAIVGDNSDNPRLGFEGDATRTYRQPLFEGQVELPRRRRCPRAETSLPTEHEPAWTSPPLRTAADDPIGFPATQGTKPSPPVDRLDDLLSLGGSPFAAASPPPAAGAVPMGFADWGLGPMVPPPPLPQPQPGNFGVARAPPPRPPNAREIFGTAPPPLPQQMLPDRFAGFNPF
jgi:hypothetical protein